MRSLRVAWMELKKLSRNKFARVATIAVCLMPLLYSVLYLWAFWDPYSHLNELRIAVVNQDQAAERDGTKVQAGQELVDKLKDDNQVGWHITDYDDAHSGLESGTYDLAIVIPENFSKTIVSATDSKNPNEQKAKLLYYSNPSNNFLADQMGGKLSLELQAMTNGAIAGQFFENIFGQISDMGDSLNEAAEGSATLKDGIQTALNGGQEISGHLGEAQNGADSLRSGLASLGKGANDLAAGYSSLAQNTQLLGSAVGQAKGGLTDAVNGAESLHNGAGELVKGLNSANNSIQSASNGADKVNEGAQQASTGIQSLTGVLHQLNGGAGQVAKGATDLKNGLTQMQTNLSSADGLPALNKGISNLNTGISGVQAQVNAANGTLSKAQSELAALLSDPGLSESQKAALKDSLQNIGMTQKILSGDGEISPGVYSIATNLSSLNAGGKQIAQGINSMSDSMTTGMTALLNGADQLASGAAALNDGLGQTETGSTQLGDGLKTLAGGTQDLASGLKSGAASFTQLVDGGESLEQGSGQLANGLGQFTPMIGKLGDLSGGVNQLLEGAEKLNAGATAASDGSSVLASGVKALYDGSLQLVDGLIQLNDGAGTLTSGLKDGAEKLSAQTPSDPTSMGTTMGEPVEVEANQIHPVKNYGTGFTPYFVPLALWVGALILFFVVNPKENRLVTAGVSPFNIVLGKYWTVGILSSIQAVIASFVVITVLKLQPDSIPGFFLINILLSLCFVAIIQLLVTTLGTPGRFIALVLLMLQLTSCQGTFPIKLTPEFFQKISPYLPMTYGTAALRHIISGSADISLGTSLLAICLFGLGALALNVLFTSKWVKVRDIHPHTDLAA